MSDLHDWAETITHAGFRRWYYGTRATRTPRWTFLEGHVAKADFKYRKTILEAFALLRKMWPMALIGSAALVAWLAFGVQAAKFPGLIVGGYGIFAVLCTVNLLFASLLAPWAERHDAAKRAKRAARKANR